MDEVFQAQLADAVRRGSDQARQRAAALLSLSASERSAHAYREAAACLQKVDQTLVALVEGSDWHAMVYDPTLSPADEIERRAELAHDPTTCERVDEIMEIEREAQEESSVMREAPDLLRASIQALTLRLVETYAAYPENVTYPYPYLEDLVTDRSELTTRLSSAIKELGGDPSTLSTPRSQQQVILQRFTTQECVPTRPMEGVSL